MSFDEEIIEAFKTAEKRKRKELSTETLTILTGMRGNEMNKRLENMNKYGLVRPSKRKVVTFWELTD